MTVLDEERCQELVGKLCSGLGWKVRRVEWTPSYVLYTNEDKWIAFGTTWKELYANFYEGRVYPLVDIPGWAKLCSSPEELALKIEVSL